jgi:hypothetical protein
MIWFLSSPKTEKSKSRKAAVSRDGFSFIPYSIKISSPEMDVNFPKRCMQGFKFHQKQVIYFGDRNYRIATTSNKGSWQKKQGFDRAAYR